MSPETRIEELGYQLRSPAPPANPKPYEPLVQTGSIVYGSGNTSMDRETGEVFAGRLGADTDVEQGQEYARRALVNALSAMKAYLGDLSRVRRVVRLTGFVNSAPDFIRQADVMNAASEMLLESFGERGRHARSALGVAQLPGGAAVEIELIVEVDR